MNVLAIRNEINSGASIYDLDLRVAYYARVSTDKDAQLNSLDNQVFYFDDFIKTQKNWTLAGGYVDEGISGKLAENRDSFMRMIRDAKARKFDLIITKEISRFSRNTLDSIMYTRKLLDCGVGVYFQSDNINTLMPDSELRLTIMASIAQEEVRKLSERLRFGYKRSIEKGRVLGQNNMLGYYKEDGRLTVNENEAPMIRRLFDLYIEQRLGFRSIARQLESEGFISPNTGRMFSYSTLVNIITNPKYKGFYCSRKTVSVDFRDNKPRRMPESEWLVYRDENIPAIVSEKTWDEANRIYKKRSMSVKDRGGSYSTRYPLSGKIFCGEHGTSYHRHVYESKKNGSQEVWNCKLYRQKGKIDGCDSPTIYTSEIYRILRDVYTDIYNNKDAVIDGLLDIYAASESKDYKKDIEKSEKEIAILNHKKDKLLELLMDSTISKEEFKKRNNQMNGELEAHAKNIAIAKNANEKTAELAKNLKLLRNQLTAEYSDTENFISGLSSEYLDRIIVHKIDGDKKHLRLEIRLNIGKNYESELQDNKCILLHEIGISQAQVSRLEKSALSRIKKQI